MDARISSPDEYSGRAEINPEKTDRRTFLGILGALAVFAAGIGSGFFKVLRKGRKRLHDALYWRYLNDD
jgi:hypothetical protein